MLPNQIIFTLALIWASFEMFICTNESDPSFDDLRRISQSSECHDDVITLCSESKNKSDITLLKCFQSTEELMEKISPKCQHYLWDYKHLLTTSNIFDVISNNLCGAELNSLEECKNAKVGHIAPCLLDHKEEVKDVSCVAFLNEISLIIFTDYHFVYKFVDLCKSDIIKLQCGRMSVHGAQDLDTDSEKNPIEDGKMTYLDYVSSQIKTKNCLMDSFDQITQDCKRSILRLEELTSSDYHLNKGLYLACVEDREVLCEHVKAGDGRIYSCLMNHKYSDHMSDKCKQMLSRKQQAEFRDFRANYPFLKSCEKDLEKNGCLKKTNVTLMSTMINCLNYAIIQGKVLDPGCIREISHKKREMMEDVNISPKLLSECKDVIKEHCSHADDKPEYVVFCLMKLASPHIYKKLGKFPEGCTREISKLLNIANPGTNDLTSDPAIRRACESSYMALCFDPHVYSMEAFHCLVKNMDSAMMTKECRDKISSLLYFKSLDMSIDSSTGQICHNDAVKLCNGPRTFEENRKMTHTDKLLEYHCMFEYFKNDRIAIDLAMTKGLPESEVKLSLSVQCGHALFKIMVAMSQKVEVNHAVIIPCFDDLSRFCKGTENKGKEYGCLQTNMKKLEPQCRVAMVTFSQIADLDIRLNRLMKEACDPMINQFCSHQRPSNIMVCLTRHKSHPEMAISCKVAIEHNQILGLEEFHIDHHFASFCGPEIEKYCLKEASPVKEKGKNNEMMVGKATIVTCLSKKIVEKLLGGEKHPLSEVCRKQFTFELLQRSETIKLDPVLAKDCSEDITRFCKQLQNKEVDSCLREHQDELTEKCHQRLFTRERLEALDADFDGELQGKCSQMIREHCPTVKGRNIFSCLHRQINEAGFDRACHNVIISRLERRMNDIRLNPGLIENCKDDIKMYCNIDNTNNATPLNGIEYEGEVILCLKKQFTKSMTSLQKNCRRKIHEIIIEANTNLKLDPILRRRCENDIKDLCREDEKHHFEYNVHNIHNCLKYSFLRKKIQSSPCKIEVVRLLRESKTDVHVDMELFDACEDAIVSLCRMASLGNGQKMKCLINLAEDSSLSKKLDSNCLSLLNDRKKMWTMAGHFESGESLENMYHHMSSTTFKGYLTLVIVMVVLSLVLVGIIFGRVTKRVVIDLKNR